MKQQTAKKILLFLSTIPEDRSKLKEETYSCPQGGTVKGTFTMDAPMRYLLETEKDIQEIIVILTPEARASAFDLFCELVLKEGGITSEQVTAIDFDMKKDHFEDDILPNVLDALEGGTEIFIESTGGGRDSIIHLLLVSQVLSYKAVPFSVIYSSYITKEVTYLDKVTNLFQMITGMQEFINTGSVDTLRKYYGAMPKDEKIGNLLTAIENLNHAIVLCAINPVSPLQQHLTAFNQAVEEGKNSSDALFSQMMNTIWATYGSNMDIPELVVWCANHGMVQQALTIYNEKMPYYLLKYVVIPSEKIEPRFEYQDVDYVTFLNGFLFLGRSIPSEIYGQFEDAVNINHFKIQDFMLKQEDLSGFSSEVAIGLEGLQTYVRHAFFESGKRKTWKVAEGEVPDSVLAFHEFVEEQFKGKSAYSFNDLTRWLCYKDNLKAMNILMERGEEEENFSENQIKTIENLSKLLPKSKYRCEIDQKELGHICRDYLYIKYLRNRSNHANENSTADKTVMEYLLRFQYKKIEEMTSVPEIQELVVASATRVKEAVAKGKSKKSR